MKLLKILYVFTILFMLFTVFVMAQEGENTPADNLRDFVISLILEGGPAYIVSAWVSKQWTKFTGLLMVIQTWVIAIILTFLSSLFGILAIPINEVWDIIINGFANGLLANIIYKIGILNSSLIKLGIAQPPTPGK